VPSISARRWALTSAPQLGKKTLSEGPAARGKVTRGALEDKSAALGRRSALTPVGKSTRGTQAPRSCATSLERSAQA